ncbi:MAG: 16S rRNA (adenine(1518)-N(6)/adenine(1519)-N(6))-dimethyltransferase RsmA [Odoribacteraceae bacterium]|jgi:16S rRNA (adenine1518-N6/adenine1519-N6)-dimethyltransferase|nr:16S rRNA (adenine(1518)-N(6)/adenine(1519)-N(6))-dimethyltransferase RsmA [Odoribacteraceae bacterium]
MEIQAKKYLGQHFLKDRNIAQKIAESLLPVTREVLEIGPGTGNLTRHLLEMPRLSVKAIEIDAEAVEYLHATFPTHRDNIIRGDFLKEELSGYFPVPFSIIGNFPYNISSQIFFKILSGREWIPQVVCMIQKEVAERLSSPPGNKSYGILSVLLQTYYTIEYLFTVHEQVFDPPPRVKSAVIRLTRNTREQLGCNEKLFLAVVKNGFNQRRKTLRNSLKLVLPGGFSSDKLSLRPEQLGVDDFIALCNEIENPINRLLHATI